MITCVVEYEIVAEKIDAFERFGLAASEQYRALFGMPPDFIEADRIRDDSGCVLRYERTSPVSPGLLNPVPVCFERGGGDVFIVVDQVIRVVEGPGQFARLRAGPGEVGVQDGGCLHAAAAAVAAVIRRLPVLMLLVIGVRLAITGQRYVRMQAVEPQHAVKHARTMPPISAAG